MNSRLRSGWLLVGWLAGLAVHAGAVTPLTTVADKTTHAPDNRSRQRALFKHWYQRLDSGQSRRLPDDVRGRLSGYPVAHYLDFAEITAGFDDRSLAENSRRVRDFLQSHDASPPARRLLHRYLAWLARKNHWREYLAFYRPADATVSEQCHALWAEIQQSPSLSTDLDARLEKLWLVGVSRPRACDAPFGWWEAQGGISDQRLQQRFELAFEKRHTDLARYLARQMKKPPAWVSQGLALLDDPLQALAKAVSWPVTERNRALVFQAALHQAQKKPADLHRLWPDLQRHFGFNKRQQQRLAYRLALFAAVDYEPFAIKAMKNLPRDWQDDAIRAWRVRYWLRQQRWREVAREIEAMPDAQRNRDRWRYWLARAWAKTGKTASARKLFSELAHQANYYGFLSADHLRLPYQICQQDAPITASRWQPPPAIERAIELYHAGLVLFAKQEWNRAYYGLNRRDKLALAGRVQAEGWHNKLMAIMADTGHWQDYRRRFPHSQIGHIHQQALAHDLAPEWVMAVIRSESGWDPHAESHARARGLMQLIDSTARRLSNKLGLAYAGPQQLFDPVFNTTLGIAYQRELFDRYNNHPLLSAAAYNAGERAAERWLSRQPSSPDIWLETISYRETREYIPRILAYTVIYDWAINQKPRRISHFMPTVPVDGKAIRPWPSRSLPRQFADVVCRAPRPAIRVAQQGEKQP